MRGLLDQELLNGAHEARVAYRPIREALPFMGDADSFFRFVEQECQIWGGATTVLLPIDEAGNISSLYASRLPGAAIDNVIGLPYGALYQNPLPPVEQTSERIRDTQFAAAMFPYREGRTQRTVETVSLREGDKWRGIYAACLGTLPDQPHEGLVYESRLRADIRFEDFIKVSRTNTSGSLEDLMERAASDDPISPRRMSMVYLSYGNVGSPGIRMGKPVFAISEFNRYDAGPNVVVICSSDDYVDLSLLWNLRAAHGDFRTAPIGLPKDECSEANLRKLLAHPRLGRNGISASQLYVTSASLSVDEIEAMVGPTFIGGREVRVVEPNEIVSFGQPGGFTRSELLVWTEGEADYIPSPSEYRKEVLGSPRLQEFALMHADVSVSRPPFPFCEDVRVWTIGGEFYGGVYSVWGRPSNRSDVKRVKWPSRLQMANAIANARQFRFNESEPGKASRILIERLGDIVSIQNLLHGPLLGLLEIMAARQGFGWYKERLRQRDIEADPLDNVGPTADDLPSRSFNDFKKVLRGSPQAARFWLLWAEKAGLIVKGFELQCPACGAQPWIPTVAFSPPVVCRSCGSTVDPPFGDRTDLTFKYRIAEPLRRVYEQDAMTHLFTSYFFYGLFQSNGLIGLHPGLEVRLNSDPQSVAGEADTILMMRNGAFIPIEVKRTAAGLLPQELDKLDRLSTTLAASWSAVAVSQYAKDVANSDRLHSLESRNQDGSYKRIVLTYDHLLNLRPIWSLGDDPVEWSPMSIDDVTEREKMFVASLIEQSKHAGSDWFQSELMYRPKIDPPRSSN